MGVFMLQVGQKVIYGNYGVCHVTEVDACMSGVEGRRYYVLESGSERKGRVFLPMDHEELVRPLMSKEEVLDLIRNSDTIEIDSFRDNNQRYMEDHFKKLLKTKDQACAMQVAKTMHMRIQEQINRGGTPSATYVRLLDQAEEQIEDEFSEVLGIPRDEIRDFIAKQIEIGQTEQQVQPCDVPAAAPKPFAQAAQQFKKLFR